MAADASSVPLPGPCYQRGAEQAGLSSTGKFQPALPQRAKAYNTWASRGGPVPHGDSPSQLGHLPALLP